MQNLKKKIQEFIFGRKCKPQNDKVDENVVGEIDAVKKTEKSTDIQNPYVRGAAGRSEWNDRYMNMAKSIKNWQIACAVISILAFVQVLVIAKLSTEAKIQPFVVETNQGIPYNIKPVTGISNKDQLLINYVVNQFVINSKTIIADTAAEKNLLDNVYAYSAGSTIGFLQDFYAKQNPFDLAGSYTVSVNIINSLAVGDNTWQITWEETKHDINSGVVTSVTKWIGHFTYQFGEVNSKNINRNPFGIYITSASWSQSQ